jgi:hypothetical protein
MSPSFDPLQPDIRQQQQQSMFAIADTRMIALIASKKNFNPGKERLLIEKARTTKCLCRHFTGTEPCLYRSLQIPTTKRWTNIMTTTDMTPEERKKR